MKYSKTDHIKIIEEIAKGMKAAGMNGAYLELGIAKARCFNRVAPYFDRSVAVDKTIKSFYHISDAEFQFSFWEDTTDGYFKKHNELFDLIFIDANHDYNNVEKDFCNSLKVLKEDGIIILHDTFPPDEEAVPHCKNAWVIQEFLKNDKDIQFINLPFYYGLTLVKRHTVNDWWIA